MESPSPRQEHAGIASREALPGGFVQLSLYAPALAAQLQPGHHCRLHMDSHDLLAMPLAADPDAGLVTVLCRPVTAEQGGILLIAKDVLLAGPFGEPLPVDLGDPSARTLVIGEEWGIPTAAWYAASRYQRSNAAPVVLLGAGDGFPFLQRPSRILLPHLPSHVIAAMPYLDERRIPSRLASRSGLPGCFEGTVDELAQVWLDHRSQDGNLTVVAVAGAATLGRLERRLRIAGICSCFRVAEA